MVLRCCSSAGCGDDDDRDRLESRIDQHWTWQWRLLVIWRQSYQARGHNTAKEQNYFRVCQEGYTVQSSRWPQKTSYVVFFPILMLDAFFVRRLSFDKIFWLELISRRFWFFRKNFPSESLATVLRRGRRTSACLVTYVCLRWKEIGLWCQKKKSTFIPWLENILIKTYIRWYLIMYVHTISKERVFIHFSFINQ